MSETFDQAVQNAVLETFENMTFMEVFPHQSENQPTALLESCGASLPVIDPFQGSFWLFLPKNLLTSIAENVYGISEEDVNDQILQDTLAELLNTITGKILQEALPDDQLFALGLPKLGEETNELTCEASKRWFFETQDSLFYVDFCGATFPFDQ